MDEINSPLSEDIDVGKIWPGGWYVYQNGQVEGPFEADKAFGLAADSEDPAVTALGECVECNDLVVKLRVPRDDVARAAAAVLERYPVADIVIEEPEIGTIIEGIIRSRATA